MVQFVEVLNEDGSEMGMMNTDFIVAIRRHTNDIGRCEAMLHDGKAVMIKESYSTLKAALCGQLFNPMAALMKGLH